MRYAFFFTFRHTTTTSGMVLLSCCVWYLVPRPYILPWTARTKTASFTSYNPNQSVGTLIKKSRWSQLKQCLIWGILVFVYARPAPFKSCLITCRGRSFNWLVSVLGQLFIHLEISHKSSVIWDKLTTELGTELGVVKTIDRTNIIVTKQRKTSQVLTPR